MRDYRHRHFIWVIHPSTIYADQSDQVDRSRIIVFAAYGTMRKTYERWKVLERFKDNDHVLDRATIARILITAGDPKRWGIRKYGAYRTEREARGVLETLRAQYPGLICEVLK